MRKAARSALAVLALILVLTTVSSVRPAAADPICLGPVCAPSLTETVTSAIPSLNIAGKLIGTLGGIVDDAVSSAAKGVLSVIGQGLSDAVGGLLDEVSAFMTTSSSPDVTMASFVSGDGAYHQVAALATVLMVLFVLLGVMQGMVAGDPLGMIARTLRSVPLAVLAVFGFPWLVDQLVHLVDAMCASLLPTGPTLNIVGHVFAADLLRVGVGFSLPAILCLLFAFLGGVAIYVELVVRAALVMVVVALSPLSFAAMVWPAARGAARKSVELVVALVVSKLAIWVALLVGIGLFQAHTQSVVAGGGAWGQMISGSAVLAVAMFAPVVVWKLMPVAEAAAVGHGLSRMPGRAAMSAVTAANMVRGRGRASGGPNSDAHPALADLPNRSIGGHGAGAGASTPGMAATRAGGAGAGIGAGGAAGPAGVVVQAAKAAKDRAASSASSQTAAAEPRTAQPPLSFRTQGPEK